VHPRPVGVEDPGHLDPHASGAVEVEEERLGGTLALVVAGAGAYRVDVASIAFGLRVHLGIAVDLARARLEDHSTRGCGVLEQMEGAQHARLQSVDRVALVLRRRSGAGKIVDLVGLQVLGQGLDDVMRENAEASIAAQMVDVAGTAGLEVVEAENPMATGEQRLA
jgi:hypothetical protein